MKSIRLLALLGALVMVTGCVKTVNDRHTFAMHPALGLFKDKFEGRYERTLDQVYAAALAVVQANGVVVRETIINPGPNQYRAIEGTIDKRKLWVRVEAENPQITSVIVQVRGKLGGTDLDLTQELQKQIAIKLARP